MVVLVVLQVANLGDSRCVLGRVQPVGAGGGVKNSSHLLLHGGGKAGGGANGSSSNVVAVPLTRDHKPDRPDEHQRILAAGGQVGPRRRRGRPPLPA